MKDRLESMHDALCSIEEDFGGDIAFIPPVPLDMVEAFEASIGWKLPDVFRYFYTHETNGMVIDDKRIYSLFDQSQKKTWVDHLQRMNDPKTSPWFVGRPHIFQDYLVIGQDAGLIFCLSKKYDLANPGVYLCQNPNNPEGVDLDQLSLDLESLILEMVKQAYQD